MEKEEKEVEGHRRIFPPPLRERWSALSPRCIISRGGEDGERERMTEGRNGETELRHSSHQHFLFWFIALKRSCDFERDSIH